MYILENNNWTLLNQWNIHECDITKDIYPQKIIIIIDRKTRSKIYMVDKTVKQFVFEQKSFLLIQIIETITYLVIIST